MTKMISSCCLGASLLPGVGKAIANDLIYAPRHDDVAVKGFDTVACFTENAADKYWPGLLAEN